MIVKQRTPKATQYTVRDVPLEVDRQLRRRAQREHRSLNQVIVEALTQATVGRPRRADFSDLGPAWVEDATFDAILEEQRAIDEGLWK